MKITKDDYNRLQTLMTPILDKYAYLIPKYKNAGLTITRYASDLYNAAGLYDAIGRDLYEYLNDNNIETALKRIARDTWDNAK